MFWIVKIQIHLSRYCCKKACDGNSDCTCLVWCKANR